MRTIVIKEGTNFQKLSAQLLSGAGDARVSEDRLKSLNPQVDFAKIEPGTVLVIPNSPDFRDDAASSVEGRTFDALRTELLASVTAAGARAVSGYEQLLTDEKDVAAALKLAGVKRTLEAEPDLKAQVEAAAKGVKQDQADAKAAGDSVKAMRQQIEVELDALAKLLE